jgi:arsenite transporter
MTTESASAATTMPDKKAIGFFEKWLTAWVFLCVVAGIVLGQLAPGPIKFIGSLQVAQVNIPSES